MPILDVVGESNGEVIDQITLAGSRISYSTGVAREVFEAKKCLYLTNEKTFSAMAGTSNGYTSFRLAE